VTALVYSTQLTKSASI